MINFLQKQGHPIVEEVSVTKQTIPKNTVDILQKIESIEKEVKDLKVSVLKKLAPTGKKAVSLKGILKGVEVTDEDINSAKKSLYSKVGL
jgi:CO dehydrogenase/acetyl-CoA synthase beta subunit